MICLHTIEEKVRLSMGCFACDDACIYGTNKANDILVRFQTYPAWWIRTLNRVSFHRLGRSIRSNWILNWPAISPTSWSSFPSMEPSRSTRKKSPINGWRVHHLMVTSRHVRKIAHVCQSCTHSMSWKDMGFINSNVKEQHPVKSQCGWYFVYGLQPAHAWSIYGMSRCLYPGKYDITDMLVLKWPCIVI